MAQYRVRTETLGQVAQTLQSVVTTFESQVGSTNSHVQSVVDVIWKGEDAATFQRSWTDFQAGSAALAATLRDLAERLRQAGASYELNETGLSGNFLENKHVVPVRKIDGAAGETTAPAASGATIISAGGVTGGNGVDDREKSARRVVAAQADTAGTDE
ncbi:WXG100 family type VII secretion target [Curtobacterium sp. NPDC090217]|uniref:WXG100 family type VII secretion target n=1 Tax=Curtobacterium sp. NPDC090217 TaxID=3363970 RepID=UPI0037FBEF1B